MSMTSGTSTSIPIGPQYERDNRFTARMRLHQSWYRAEVLKVGWGTGPGPNGKRELGSMLLPDDGAGGQNFLTPQILDVARRRMADKTGTVDEYRLRHNMLSSQPMCFNLFGHLELNLDLATRTFAALDPDVQRVTCVLMEYAPEPAADHLNDRTAFDAFVAYERRGGGKGFFGIETKLTEKFSQKEYDTPAYRRWLEVPGAPWRLETADELPRMAHNQLWRNHLLAYSLQHLSEEYATGTVAVVGHPLDLELTQTIAGYRALLKEPDCLRVWTVADVVEAASHAVQTDLDRDWLEAFKVRYLRLDLSEEDWRAFQQAGRRR